MLQCGDLNSAHLPILIGIMCSITFGATYVMAVFRGDVDPVLPYISDTAIDRPESCVFAQMLNAVAFLCLLVMYLRYRMLHELTRDSDWWIERVNSVSMLIGCASVFGLTIVANFQVSAVFAVHITGALLHFSCAVVYGCSHAWLTCPLTFGCIASVTYHHRFLDTTKSGDWSSAGYRIHTLSAICEWLLAVANIGFLMSYSRDFEKLKSTVHVQALVQHLDDSPVVTSSSAAGLLHHEHVVTS